MRDIKNVKILWLKAALFALVAGSAGILLWLEAPTWRAALLLVLVVWASCRAYYFAFYVIEHYVDPGFRFAGLGSFLAYLLGKRRGK